MIQTILIVLVAVVVLIVIIAVLALRYLRADDSDTFDDIPDEPRRTRRPPNPDNERRLPAPGRRPRPPAAPDGWADERPARVPDGRAPAAYRDRDTGPRAAVPDRASGPRRSPAGTRPARPARQNNADAATSSWDSLSDVDYWTELAADQSHAGPAAGPAPAARRGGEPGPESRPQPAVRTSRRGGEPGPESRPQPAVRTSRRGGEPGPESRPQPAVRTSRHSVPAAPAAWARRQPVAAADSSSARAADFGQTEQIDLRAGQPPARHRGDASTPGQDLPTRRGGRASSPLQRPESLPTGSRSSAARRATGPRPVPQAQPPRPQQAPAPASSNGHGRSSRRDDDPLTSPSFPAVNASDSRSYRARRSAAGQPEASGQHALPAVGTAGATSRQFIEYSSAPSRTTSAPHGYPVQSAAGQPDSQQSAVPPAAANPYGSYVSQPEPTSAEPAYQPAGYPDSAASSFAAAGYSGSPAGYPLGQRANGFLPADGLGSNGAGVSRGRHGAQPNGYADIDYSGLGYDQGAYADDQGAFAGYRSSGQHAAQYDQLGYGTDGGYGPEEYQGYSGYGTSSR